MIPDPAAALPWLFASCFGMSVVSALVPWFNGEAIALSFAVLMRSPLDLALLALAASAGQMLGKGVLYYLGSGARRLHKGPSLAGQAFTPAPSGTVVGRAARWSQSLEQGSLRAMALVFLSSTVGIPPLYLTTLAAGAVGMRFSSFAGAAALGRIVRFSAVVYGAGLALHAAGR